MTEQFKKQVLDDFKEVLSTEAGKRVFGHIFSIAGLNRTGLKNEYAQGIHDLALTIANTVREFNPYSVAECEIAFLKMKEAFEIGRADYDNYDSDSTKRTDTADNDTSAI